MSVFAFEMVLIGFFAIMYLGTIGALLLLFRAQTKRAEGLEMKLMALTSQFPHQSYIELQQQQMELQRRSMGGPQPVVDSPQFEYESS